MLTFVDHGRQFEDDSLTNWKPIVTISKKTYMKQVHLHGGICDEKQWGINIKIEEKLRKN